MSLTIGTSIYFYGEFASPHSPPRKCFFWSTKKWKTLLCIKPLFFAVFFRFFQFSSEFTVVKNIFFFTIFEFFVFFHAKLKNATVRKTTFFRCFFRFFFVNICSREKHLFFNDFWIFCFFFNEKLKNATVRKTTFSQCFLQIFWILVGIYSGEKHIF